MSSFSHSFPDAADRDPKEIVARDDASPSWMFWLSLILVWVAMFSIEHRLNNASVEVAEYSDGKPEALDSEGSSASRQLSVVALGLMGAALLVIPTKLAVSPSWLLFSAMAALATLLLISASWSDDSILTLKRSSQPILLVLAALGIAKHCRAIDVCRFAAMFSGTVLLIGVVASCASGTFLTGDAYRFGGTLHPNSQAVNCAILSLSSLALFWNRDETGAFQWRWTVPFAFGLAFLLLTRSRTTTIAYAAGVVMFGSVGLSWRARFALFLWAAAGLLAGACLLLIPDSSADGALMGMLRMGREDEDIGSLTGRLPIWQAISGDIAKQPILGYGYGGFWTDQQVWDYSFIRHWEFNHAHSAYLESLLNLGFVGLLLGLFLVLSSAGAAATNFASTGDVGFRFIAALMVLALVHGLVDSNFVIFGFAPLLIMLCISVVALRARATPVADPAPTLSARIEYTPVVFGRQTAK
jgi:exopolysaccharide production protein ExoQ